MPQGGSKNALSTESITCEPSYPALVVVFIFAVAGNDLTSTCRTTLNVTTSDMELPLKNATIMAWLPIGAPIIFLLPITKTLVFVSRDYVRLHTLCFFDLRRPLCGHPNPVVDNMFLSKPKHVSSDRRYIGKG
jgi:hypothetical protein